MSCLISGKDSKGPYITHIHGSGRKFYYSTNRINDKERARVAAMEDYWRLDSPPDDELDYLSGRA